MEFAASAGLVAIGLIGGVWNAVAGGATLFTFPALMLAGLPPVVANATNYLAMLPGNAAALPAYRRELSEIGARLGPLLVVSSLGALLGALLLIWTDEAVFVSVAPALILLATGMFAFGDRLRALISREFSARGAHSLLLAALFLFSIYGGYFGAGLSFVLLAIAQLMGFASFHAANGVKNLLATSFTLISIGVFSGGGLIAWDVAGLVMIGAAIGGYLGGRLARHVDERALRGGVIAYGVALSAIYLLSNLGLGPAA